MNNGERATYRAEYRRELRKRVPQIGLDGKPTGGRLTVNNGHERATVEITVRFQDLAFLAFRAMNNKSAMAKLGDGAIVARVLTRRKEGAS